MRRRRSCLSFCIALFLTVGAVAPCAVESRGLLANDTMVVRTIDAATTDGAQQSSRPKGNGFVRALTAPFRALGRLFGGGKKRATEEAKRRDSSPSSTTSKDQVALPIEHQGIKETTSEEAKKRDRKQQKTAAAAEPSTGAALVLAPEPKAAPQTESARIVRPSEGQAVEQLPKAAKWIPVIDGISKDPLSQGRALLQHGYINEAVSELSIASTVGPDLVEANNLLGLAYDRLGMRNLALEAYERALSAAPDNAQVLNNLGYSLSLAGRHADALKRLKQAERRAPGSPQVLQNIALVQARMGKFDDAYKSLTRAFGEYEARIKTAALLEQANRIDEAIKHYTSALKMQPDSQTLLERLAELYERTGRTREAQEARRALGTPRNKQKTATGGGG